MTIHISFWSLDEGVPNSGWKIEIVCLECFNFFHKSASASIDLLLLPTYRQNIEDNDEISISIENKSIYILSALGAGYLFKDKW